LRLAVATGGGCDVRVSIEPYLIETGISEYVAIFNQPNRWDEAFSGAPVRLLWFEHDGGLSAR